MALERVSDLTRKILDETRQKFSLARLLEECADGGGLRNGLEHEACSETARAVGLRHDPNRPIVSWSLLAKRDATVASDSAGGFLRGVDTLDAIDSLRPWSVSVRAGLTVVPGLKGNAAFPKTTGNVTPYWLANEAATLTVSQAVLGQVALVPKTAGALVKLSRQLMKQSAQTEPFIRRELLRTIGGAIDQAVLNGAGSTEPLGVLNTPTIGTQSGTSLAWSGVLTMQKTVAEANADDAVVSFIGTPAVRALLAAREKSTGSGFIWADGRVAGAPGYVTKDMPAGTLICGAWPEVLLGLFGGGLELAISPNNRDDFMAGIVQVRCMASCDVACAFPVAFSVAASIT
jgi:HK97 family phage major capsid protein